MTTDATAFLSRLEAAFPAYADDDARALWAHLQHVDPRTAADALARHAAEPTPHPQRPDVDRVIDIAREILAARVTGRINGECAAQRADRLAREAALRNQQANDRAAVAALPAVQLAALRKAILATLTPDERRIFRNLSPLHPALCPLIAAAAAQAQPATAAQ
ncbi:MAG TPA: hypothetical protein VF624_18820 [Tepidisphaeraceae bacterium]